MRIIICKSCGSNVLDELNGFRVCRFCGTKYQLTAADQVIKKSVVAINNDVER